MSVRTDAEGKIVKREAKPATPEQQLTPLQTALTKMFPAIERTVPKHIRADRMARICMTALQTVPDMEKCTPVSFMAAVLSAAQLGLEPNTPLGECWLIPRWSNRRRGFECTLQLGYQGMESLSYRSGMVAAIRARAVRQGDHFVYSFGLEETLEFKPSDDPDRASKPLTHAWAAFKLKSGESVFDVLNQAEVFARRDRSSSRTRDGKLVGPWITDEEAMWRKSAIRATWRDVPKSAMVAMALAMDDASELGSPLRTAVDPEILDLLHRERLDFEDDDGEEKELIESVNVAKEAGAQAVANLELKS